MHRVRTLAMILAVLCIATSVHAADGDYRLDTGDRVRVAVQGWPEATTETLVAGDGTIALPGVGRIAARNLTPAEVGSEISTRLVGRSPGPPPVAVVDIIRYRSVFILGDVQKPGEYEFRPGLTVIKAISIAGGFYRPPASNFDRIDRDAILARGDARTYDLKAKRLLVTKARLEAELDGKASFDLPDEIKDTQDDPDVGAIIKEAQAALGSNRAILVEQTKGLEGSKALLQEEIASLNLQMAAETRQLDYVKRELGKMNTLNERGLANSARMLDLERNAAQISGARQALETSVVRSRQEIQRADQRIAELKDEQVRRARSDLHKVMLDLDEAMARRRTSRNLITEAETYTPSSDSEGGGARVKRRYVLVRADDPSRKEEATDKNGSMRPGDVLEVIKIVDPERRPLRGIASGAR